ncbi:MAG: hypothetical protein JSS66_12555 [Armatimonadetes bacterium]|nr:hypothetical protein [Armatimonadota bacterium]
MKNDKKKMIVLAGLGVALLAVGAFQFIGKGSPPPAPAVTKATKEATAHKASTGASSATSGTTQPAAAATGSSASNGQPSGESPAATPAGATGTAEAETDPQRQVLLQMVKNPLPRRDPFESQDNRAPDTTPAQPVQTAPQQPVKPVHRPTAERFAYSAPVSPLAGTLPNGGTSPGMDVSHAPPLRQPSEFAYKVTGVIVGHKPMAVFEDDSGNQRLVPVGGSIDGDSKVVGVERGKVRIVHRGKEKTLSPQEGQ